MKSFFLPPAIRTCGSALVALAAGLVLISTARADDDVPLVYQRTNPRILAAFRQAVAGPARSTVRIRSDGKDVALGTIVAADGWILTKASELKGEAVCRLRDGRELPARVVKTDERFDLALLKIEARGLSPVRWWASKVAPVGNWVAAPGLGQDPVAIGVVSVAARQIATPREPWLLDRQGGGYLGIGLDPAGGLARIDKVMTGTPAALAGLKPDDVILSIGGKATRDGESLMGVLMGFKAGDKVDIRIKRGDKEMTLRGVKLGKRPGNRADFQNRLGSKLSDRRQGFPTILQHDTVLRPSDCGGPVVDLDGNVIGINIARAGRTESYAVPSEAVLPLLRTLSLGKVTAVLVEKDTTPVDKSEPTTATASR
jgi:serine protease Do